MAHTTKRKAKYNAQDTETKYARAIAANSIDQTFNIDELMQLEIAPYPTSFFEVDVPLRSCPKPDNEFLDGCAILWLVA